MGLAVGDYNGDGAARSAEDAFRRRHPGALPEHSARASSRTSPSAAGLGVLNRYVEWGAGMPDLDNDGRPDVDLRDRQRLPGSRSACSRSIRIAARASSSATSTGSRFEDVTRASGPGAHDAALEPRRRVRRLRQRRRRRRARHEHERAAVTAAQRLRRARTTGSSVKLEGTTSNRAAIGATVT